MLNIKLSEHVPYNTNKMFQLVNDVTSYPLFIPGCRKIEIFLQNNQELIVKTTIEQYMFKESFITHNLFIYNTSIIINLVQGPFSFFFGKWQFYPLNEYSSIVEFQLSIKLNNIILEKVFKKTLHILSINIMQAFINRAKNIYGSLKLT